MYLDFFGLEREPFHITPDPDFLFPSPSHKEAFATVMYGVQQQKGFVVVTGEVGTGKTTVLRAYLQKLKGTDIQPIYVFDPHLDFEELLEAILAELGAPHDAGHTQFSRLQWLRHYLIDAYSSGRSVVLIIDEAQNMPVETMEKLRVLTNLETTKDKLLQVLLVGQPELEEKLGLHQLRQLNQRVAVRATLRPLAPAESADYVKHRVRQAGGVPETIFTPGALNAIVKHAKGNPRVLNITCDNVLACALGAQQCPITPKLVNDVLRDLSPRSSRRYELRRMAPLAAAAAAILIVGIGAGSYFRGAPSAEAAAPSPEPAEPVQAAVVTPAPDTSAEPAPAKPEPSKPLDAKEIALRKMLNPVTTPVPPVIDTLSEVAMDIPTPDVTEAPVAVAKVEPEPALEPVVESAPVSEPAASTTVEEEPIPAVIAEPAPAEATTSADRLPVIDGAVEPEPAEPDSLPAEVPEPEPAPAKQPEAEVLPAPIEESELAPAPEPETVVAALPEPEPVAAPEPATAPEPEVVAAVVAPEAEPVSAPATEVSQPREPREQEPLQPAPVLRDANGRLVRQVQKGDKLILLLEEVYGKSNGSLIESVQEANPRIVDPNLILAGEELVFPNAVKNVTTPGDGADAAAAGN